MCRAAGCLRQRLLAAVSWDATHEQCFTGAFQYTLQHIIHISMYVPNTALCLWCW